MAVNTSPINRSAAIMPRSPKPRCSRCAPSITALATSIGALSARIQAGGRPGSRDAISMTVASAEGPAIEGTANGTMKGSLPGRSPNTPSGWRNTMRSAIRNRMMPPAIESETSESCSHCRNSRPSSMKASSTTYAIKHSRSTMGTRRAAGTLASAEITIGTFTNGSMTNNKRTAAETTSASGTAPQRPSVEFHLRLEPAAQEATDGVERDAKIAVDRDLVKLVERRVHDACDQSLDQHVAADQPPHQVPDGGELAEGYQRAVIVEAELRQRLPLDTRAYRFDQHRRLLVRGLSARRYPHALMLGLDARTRRAIAE